MRDFGDAAAMRKMVYDNALNAARNLQPYSNARHTLSLQDVDYADDGDYTIADQKRALLAGDSLSRRLRGTWVLTDKDTGKVLDQKKQTIAHVPYVTPRGTMIHRGNAYVVVNQQRLQPGLYTRIKDNNELETHANILPGDGVAHRYFLDPEKSLFYARVKQAKIPLLPLLRAMGASDAQLREAWGPEILAANMQNESPAALRKYFDRLLPAKDRDLPENEKKARLVEILQAMKTNPRVNKRTMGQEFENLSPEAILASTKKLIAISRGEAEPDDRDHLAYQTIVGPEDLIAERLAKDYGGMRRKLFHRASWQGNLKSLPPNSLNKQVEAAILHSGLGQCFDGETSVLTRRGFVLWPEVREDDEFACRIDGKLEYHKASRLFVYDFDGELIGCRTKRFSYLVTPNHRCYFRYRHRVSRGPQSGYQEATAEELFGKQRWHLTSLGSRRETHADDSFVLRWVADKHGDEKTVEVEIEDWADFLGWWLAEGSAFVDGRNYTVTIAKTDPDGCQEIESLLDRLPFHWQRSSNGADYVIRHKGLYEAVMVCGVRENKRIPRYALDWPEWLLRRLFDCFTAGDGNEYDGYIKTELAAHGLAEDLVEVWGRFGGTAQISLRDRSDEGWKTYAVVSFSQADERCVESSTAAKKHGYDPHFKQKYTGKVYCAAVPGEMLYVMRDGKPHWSLNSLEEINPAEVFDKQTRISRLGEGGIPSVDAIPEEARSVQPSHFGFMDPIRTPECYDERTEVMTKQGWKRWVEVVEADEFACLVDNQLEFHRAINLTAADYEGPMYGAETARISYLVTPNHRMYVRPYCLPSDCPHWRIEPAEEVYDKNRRLRCGGHRPFKGRKIKWFTLPPADKGGNNTSHVEKIDFADWADLVGWFLAEGHCTYDEEKSAYSIGISQSQEKNPGNCDLIEELLGRLPFAWSYNHSMQSYILATKQLAAYFRQFGYCYEKWIPAELLGADEAARQRLFDSLLRGDGRANRRGEINQFCSTSKRLSEDFQRLAFSLGWSTRLVCEPDLREDRYHDNWVVHLHSSDERVVTRRGGHHRREHYAGKVYCAEVPGGLLYVRRNDKAGFWCGNSFKVGVDVHLSRAARKGDDGKIYAPFRDLRTGKTVYRSPQDVADMAIAFPGQMDSPSKRAWAMYKGREQLVPKDQIRLELPHFEDAFSPLGNLVPLKSTTKGQRMAMASRMLTQSLPLVNAEAPLVQSGVPGQEGKSFESLYGDKLGAVRASQSGKVVSVEDGSIKVRYQDGTEEDIELYQNFPYNRKSVTGSSRVVIRRDGRVRELEIADYAHVEGDCVLSIDPVKKISAWQKIEGFVRHENDKLLLRVRTASGRYVDVTSDHSLITLGDDGELRPIYPADCVINLTRLPVAMLPVTGYSEVSISKATLAGLYLAEGHLPEQPGLVQIAVDPEDRAEQVMTLLRNCGLSPYRSGGNVCFTDHATRAWLLENFGEKSGGKFVHSDTFSWSNTRLEALIAGYMGGDGNLWSDSHGAIQVTAVSTSQRLRDGLANVLSLLNVFVTFFSAPRSHLNENWNDGFGFRVISRHLSKLSRWFFYADRQVYFENLLKDKYRASPFELVPIAGKAARKTLYAGFDEVPKYVYKTAHQGAVAKHRLAGCRGAFGAWGGSDVMWDTVVAIEPIPHEPYVYDFQVSKSEVFAVNNGLVVHNTYLHQTPLVTPGQPIKKGQVIARSNYTDDAGEAALGVNLRVGYIPFRGLNYEDAVVISQSAAEKMTSEHMYQHRIEPTDEHKLGKRAYQGLFSGRMNKEELDKFDDDGVVTPGTVVKFDDPLILAAKQVPPSRHKVHKKGSPGFQDASVKWNHHSEGIVTDVHKGKKGITVLVKAHSPMQVGDKLSGRYGDKGVVADIIPDEQMPHGRDGKALEILLNPNGIISRTNPTQKLEAILGKIAAKTGQVAVPQDFGDVEDWDAEVIKLMEEAGITDTETVIDPETGRKLLDAEGNEPLVGNRFFMKLHHMAESKGQGRGTGGYTAEETPAKGGEFGSKRISMMDTNAILSHGATSVLRDMRQIRGQNNPDFWLAFMQGHSPNPPGVPLVYKKFVNQLRAAGINVVADGKQTHIMALTGDDVKKLSGSRRIKNGDTVRLEKGLEPVAGGLFDPKLTGGHNGDRWSYIQLDEPMPNPVMEEPIRRLLGLTQKKLRDVLAGREELVVDGAKRSGPKAVSSALDAINLDRELLIARAQIKGGKKTERDAAVRKLGYLKSAKRLGVHPREWVLDRVPVLPPRFRPISVMADTKIPLVSDANYLYKELLDANDSLAEMRKRVDDVGEERLAVYDSFKAITGLGDPLHPKLQEKQVSGVLKHIFGNSPKYGTVQRRLLSSTVDLVGRAVITPDPDLDMDRIGLPENRAWKVYDQFVIRRLRRRGLPLAEAAKQVKERTGLARQELLNEMEHRPVIMTRAPVLHRFGVMAFFPKLTADETVHVSPLIVKGFNADFDGDAVNYHVPVLESARQEAIERMLPSANLISPADFKTPMHIAGQEYIAGLFEATRKHKKPKRTHRFASQREAIQAYRRGDISIDTPVEVDV